MPTFTVGPDAAADGAEAEAALHGIATAATSTDSTIHRRPTRPFAPMVPPTVTTAARGPNRYGAHPTSALSVVSKMQKIEGTRLLSQAHLPPGGACRDIPVGPCGRAGAAWPV